MTNIKMKRAPKRSSTRAAQGPWSTRRKKPSMRSELGATEPGSDIRLSKTAMKSHDDWCRRNGYPVQGSSSKLQAASIKRYNNTDYKASSFKRQAS